MMGVIVSHVTVGATDVDASVAFYVDLFGAAHVELLPSPNLGGPNIKVAWLRLGQIQLHLGQRQTIVRDVKDHFGIGVSDRDLFHDIYRKAKERNILQPVPFGHHIYELPAGDVQMYVVDPSGNTLEIDYPDARDIDRTLIPDMRLMSERWPQPADAANTSIFTSPSGDVLLHAASSGEGVR